jgi:hypothetical protein
MNSFKNPSGEIDVLSVELTPPIGELGEPVYFYETRDLLKLISVLLSSCSTATLHPVCFFDYYGKASKSNLRQYVH